MMDPETLKTILLEASLQPSTRREEIIDERCDGDLEAAQRLRELFAALDDASGLLQTPAEDLPFVNHEMPLPKKIAGRRILGTLGEGGFGLVYLAEEGEPTARQVAIKTIRPGQASRDVIERFDSERRMLALMNHPGITQIFDAGVTDDGIPFVVMEVVDGPAITTYVQAQHLSIRERVQLIEKTAHAIYHAHQRGVIHRDIKPSNVMVVQVDGEARPKVIDFGIGKALGGPLANTPSHRTATAQVIGTPSYMAPEQTAGGGFGVDTRTDVYGLGALLYECLVGVPPFDPERFAGVPLTELERIIREEEPLRPSMRAARIEAADSHGPRARQLAGELDWIVQRALHKDPDHRYPSAAALARDLRRWLDGDAIEAGRPSRLYKFRKLVRRHRLEFASAITVFVLIIAGLVSSLIYADRASDAAASAQRERNAAERARRAADDQRIDAERAREEAVEGRHAAERHAAKFKQIAEFTQSIFTSLDPTYAGKDDTTLLRRILLDAERRFFKQTPGDEEVAGTLALLIAVAFRSIAEYDHAVPLAEIAAERLDGGLGPLAPLALEARMVQAVATAEAGQLADALPIARSVHERRLALFGPDDPRTLEALATVGRNLIGLERHREAHVAIVELHRRRSATLGPSSERTIDALDLLARTHSLLGEREAAAGHLQRVVEAQTQLHGPNDPSTLSSRNDLGNLYHELGRLEEAERELAEVAARKETILPPTHDSVIATLANLALVLSKRGKTAESIKVYREAIDRCLGSKGDHSLKTTTLQLSLAGELRKDGQPKASLPLFDEALLSLRKHFPATHFKVLDVRTSRAVATSEAGDHAAAFEQIQATLEVARKALVKRPRTLTQMLVFGAGIAMRNREIAAGLLLYREADFVLKTAFGEEDEDRHEILRRIEAIEAAIERAKSKAKAQEGRG